MKVNGTCFSTGYGSITRPSDLVPRRSHSSVLSRFPRQGTAPRTHGARSICSRNVARALSVLKAALRIFDGITWRLSISEFQQPAQMLTVNGQWLPMAERSSDSEYGRRSPDFIGLRAVT